MLDEIVKLVENAADDIVILVDACAIRHDVRDEVNELITRTGYPVYSAPMGKTAVSENYERYGGVRVSLYVLRLFIASITVDICRIHQSSRYQREGRISQTHTLCRLPQE